MGKLPHRLSALDLVHMNKAKWTQWVTYTYMPYSYMYTHILIIKEEIMNLEEETWRGGGGWKWETERSV